MVGNLGYQHLTVNHFGNFIHPLTGTHTNDVVNMWRHSKGRNKRECGTHRHMMDSYLVEFML